MWRNADALRGVAQKICFLSVDILEMSSTDNLRARFILLYQKYYVKILLMCEPNFYIHRFL